ncbi:MAG TPA: aminopeptidase P family N-terminal domain-containing protein, partial [Paralcaligenes sp.]
MSNSVFAERIDALRAVMATRKVDAYIVVSSDPHLSEYLPEHWQARQWLSGFDGSAGTLVVTARFAGLWTDSRYWVQAEHDLNGTGIQTIRAGD